MHWIIQHVIVRCELRTNRVTERNDQRLFRVISVFIIGRKCVCEFLKYENAMTIIL